MEPSMILAIAVFVFLLVTVAQGVRQVPGVLSGLSNGSEKYGSA